MPNRDRSIRYNPTKITDIGKERHLTEEGANKFLRKKQQAAPSTELVDYEFLRQYEVYRNYPQGIEFWGKKRNPAYTDCQQQQQTDEKKQLVEVVAINGD